MNNQKLDTKVVFSELLPLIRKSSEEIDSYFNHIAEREILNPLAGAEKVTLFNSNDVLPAGFFSGFGIRRLILSAVHGRLSLSEKEFVDSIPLDAPSFSWRTGKPELVTEDLKMLFENSRIIEFDNWADVTNASDIWDNLRRHIIKPLRNVDFEFIFHLGDSTEKFGFEVDEFLDIMCDFSLYGRVTLMLGAKDVANLWEMFYGKDTSKNTDSLPRLTEKSASVFDLINIGQLIVDAFPETLLFSRNQQFSIHGGEQLQESTNGHKYFSVGYILALLLKLDSQHAISLGLIISEMYPRDEFRPDADRLLRYLEDRVKDKSATTFQWSSLTAA